MGPPVCDELIALVEHAYTEREASVVRHLPPVRGLSAHAVARLERRPVLDIAPMLEDLATKRTVGASGDERSRRYRIVGVMPGLFEMVLIGQAPDALSPWHRRFAELFEALYETGYAAEYAARQSAPPALARYLPVGQSIQAHPMALPCEQLEVVLDRYRVFGVGHCQCRTATRVAGRGCGKPAANCTLMGKWAERGISQGWLTRVSRQDVLEIKREAEAHGMVNWLMNVEGDSQSSCSCCGCCCHAMRLTREFNVPSMMAPPHFLPRIAEGRCTHCGKCARQCPMGALEIAREPRTRLHHLERCIGCGLCLAACGSQRAISMEAVPDYHLPYRSWYSFLLRQGPGMLTTAWRVWNGR
jgi:Na+-translocating ferredoxin:NAD+ oxidoreductase subunit B